jgi:hypothetical protein
MIVFLFQGLQGEARNRKFELYCSLNEKALWKLRDTLRVLGIDTPDDDSELDPDDVDGKRVTGIVENHEHQGVKYSRLVTIVNDEDAPEAPRAKDNGAKVSVAEIQEMDQEDLESLIRKIDLGLDLSKHKTLSKKREAVLRAMEDSEFLEYHPPPTKGATK